MRATNDWLLVRPVEVEMSGMLLVPEGSMEDQLKAGIAVQISGDTDFKVGDTLFFPRNGIVMVRWDGEEYYFIHNKKVIGYEQSQD